jgi:hypothetical protein
MATIVAQAAGAPTESPAKNPATPAKPPAADPVHPPKPSDGSR